MRLRAAACVVASNDPIAVLDSVLDALECPRTKPVSKKISNLALADILLNARTGL